MNDLQKMMFKNSLENNTLDVKKFFDEYNIVLNLDNYKFFLNDIIKIINETRSNMYLSDLENLYPYQQLVANDIYKEVYEQIMSNSKIEQMPKEVFEDLKKFYKRFNSITEAGALRINLVKEEENETRKVK